MDNPKLNENGENKNGITQNGKTQNGETQKGVWDEDSPFGFRIGVFSTIIYYNLSISLSLG